MNLLSVNPLIDSSPFCGQSAVVLVKNGKVIDCSGAAWVVMAECKTQIIN